MSTCVVDVSVAVKWFVPEQDSVLALGVLRREDLIAPDLLWPEIGSIIWRKVQRRELGERDARSILALFLNAPITMYSSGILISTALDIALGTGRSVYDSLYLALAAVEGCKMITADRRLFNSLAGTPYAALLVWLGDIDPAE